jgi:hypothetical protein
MTATVSSIWRHPIKSHGREELWSVTLRTGQTLPWDRVWAVAHEASKATSDAWSPCAGFSRVSKAPALMAITATLDEAHERICLRHPDCPELDFAPDTEAERFLAWVAPLMPADRAASARIVRVPGRGMTDSDFPSVTLCSLSSHQAVEQHLGQSLSINRWRGNIWLDGLAPWQEFEWLDREIRIGDALLRVRERTYRCLATTANPDTGHRDADMLGALQHWGHKDFGVRAEVIEGGALTVGSSVEVL